MNTEIRRILENVRDGSISIDDALLKIKQEPYTDLGYAKIDNHRKIRQGAAEVIYGAGKTAEQIIGITRSLREQTDDAILITRMDEDKAEQVSKELAHALQDICIYHSTEEIHQNKTAVCPYQRRSRTVR